MSQLSLWGESPSSQPPSASNTKPTSTSVGAEQRGKPKQAAARCLTSADKLQKHIDAKHASANNMLAQRPTRKRLSDAGSIRKEAIRLERIQTLLRRLAKMHEDGTIQPVVANLTSRGAIESALFTAAGDSPIRVLYNSIAGVESKPHRILRLTTEASMMKIPGFFPTPEPLAERVLALAQITEAVHVLEPSAGTGNLIDAIRKHSPHSKVSFCEANLFLLDILREKYEGCEDVHFLRNDFRELDPRNVERPFDRVIMNPPFENGQDAEHLLHAHTFLKPGGLLVAIISVGLFSRRDRKATAFRAFLESKNATVQDVPAGMFKPSGTEIPAKIVCIRARS